MTNPKELVSRREVLSFLLNSSFWGMIFYALGGSKKILTAAGSTEQEQNSQEIIPVTEVETIADLEAHFRSEDAVVLGQGKTIHDFSGEEIKQKRREHGLLDTPFQTTIIVSKKMVDAIKLEGQELIGTDDFILFFLAHHVYWSRMCQEVGLPATDKIRNIVVISDPEFNATTMQRMREEGNTAAGPWRTHYVNDNPDLVFHEPLLSDQVTIYPKSFIDHGYPFDSWPAEWVIFSVNGEEHRIRIDIGAIHEWFGHTKGKENTAGNLPDHYHYNRLDFETLFAVLGISSKMKHFFWDLDSVMNGFLFGDTGVRLSGIDTALIKYRSDYSEPFGGIHAEGLCYINWPDGSIGFVENKLHNQGYDIIFLDRDGIPITSKLDLKEFGLIRWNSSQNNNQFIPVQYSQDSLSVPLDTSIIQPCQYVALLNAEKTPQLLLPRPLFSLFALENAENTTDSARIEIFFNTTAQEIDSESFDPESNIDTDMYTLSFLGKVDPSSVADHPEIIAWTSVKLPKKGNIQDFITIFWTTKSTFDMTELQVLPPLEIETYEYYLPLVTKEGDNLEQLDLNELNLNEPNGVLFISSQRVQNSDVRASQSPFVTENYDEKRAEYLRQIGVLP